MVSVIVVFIQWLDFKLNSRDSIKTDLEIMNKLGSSDSNYLVVKATVDKRTRHHYGEKPPISPKRMAYGIFVLDCKNTLYLVGVAYWLPSPDRTRNIFYGSDGYGICA